MVAFYTYHSPYSVFAFLTPAAHAGYPYERDIQQEAPGALPCLPSSTSRENGKWHIAHIQQSPGLQIRIPVPGASASSGELLPAPVKVDV